MRIVDVHSGFGAVMVAGAWLRNPDQLRRAGADGGRQLYGEDVACDPLQRSGSETLCGVVIHMTPGLVAARAPVWASGTPRGDHHTRKGLATLRALQLQDTLPLTLVAPIDNELRRFSGGGVDGSK
jgi:hypothetical protein